MIEIGRKDYIDLPELGLTNIEAKIDTGAYGCSLHCHQIKVEQIEEKMVLKFKVLDPSHPEYEDRTYIFEEFSEKIVKNSGGQSERRYTIKTQLIIFDTIRNIEFSLTDRKEMRYPVLLGRKFLKKQFLVNVNVKDVSYKIKRNKA